MSDIETAIAYFSEKEVEYNGKVPANEVLEVLNFMHHCLKNGLKMVGIKYERFDGKSYNETPASKMYEGGFAVE